MASTEASQETAIVPRWEWRTFGERFDVAADELGALAPDRIEESDEIYLLSLDGTDTVKVRGGLVDAPFSSGRICRDRLNTQT